ncbi:hypothetical protein [Lactococcus lactis]|nr:hypothetical protein [Lactococcus lactis]
MVKDSAIDHQKEFIMQIGDYQSLEKISEEQDCKVRVYLKENQT